MTDRESFEFERSGAIYHVDCSLGGDMRRVSTPVMHRSTREAGRLMTAALISTVTKASDRRLRHEPETT